jgi:hypothetical protein
MKSAVYFVAIRKEAVELLKSTGMTEHLVNENSFLCLGLDYEASFLVMKIHNRLRGKYEGLIDFLIPLDFVLCIAGFEDEKSLGFAIGDKANDKWHGDNH